MPIPAADFGMEIRRAVRAARNPESYARAMLTRGSGPVGLDPALAGAPLRVILVEPLTPAARPRSTATASRSSPCAPSARPTRRRAPRSATTSPACSRSRRRSRGGAHEALILDTAGHVVEGTTSNVFVVRGGEIVTPPEQANILAGHHPRAPPRGRRRAGPPPSTSPTLTPADLAAADEVFLSSSLREVLPVVRVDDRPVGDGRPGPVTRALHAAFRARVGLGGEPMPWEPRAARDVRTRALAAPHRP